MTQVKEAIHVGVREGPEELLVRRAFACTHHSQSIALDHHLFN